VALWVIAEQPDWLLISRFQPTRNGGKNVRSKQPVTQQTAYQGQS
jgi:hypothetical protein